MPPGKGCGLDGRVELAQAQFKNTHIERSLRYRIPRFVGEHECYIFVVTVCSCIVIKGGFHWAKYRQISF
jgi:hypothetical protein